MTDTSRADVAAGRPGHVQLGVAGRTARAFIELPLTPLLLLAFFLIGLLGMLITPREEDPQISVPMVDVFVAYPGASSSEVANLIAEPLERLMSELSGVKHVYSMSREGMAMVTVRFDVGEQMEPSLVKLYNNLFSHMDAIPKGVMQPLVKPKSIDDVPVVTVTLSSDRLDLVQLRKLGLDVNQRFKALPDTGQSFVVGGSREQIRIDVDLPRLASHNVTLGQVAHAVAAANQRMPAGDVVEGSKWFNIYTGAFLADLRDVENLVVAVDQDRPVFLRDVAKVTQGESETKSVVDQSSRMEDGEFKTDLAVTVAVAKKRGSNGIDVAASMMRELEGMKGSLISGFGAGHRVARLWRERARQGFSSDIQIVHRLGAGHRSGFPDHGASPGADRDGDHSGRSADVAGRRLCAEIHHQPRVDVRAGFRHRHIGRRRHRGGGKHLSALARNG